ncbi:MAG: DUF6531 domain-containing protein [Dokdonella sp.]|nr:DUF6531 domain-containing protein [Dokdonella sp.]
MFAKNQIYECEAGFNSRQGDINQQNFYGPDQLIDGDGVCRSTQTGVIIASLLPAKQCKYGNPCVPASGEKIHSEIDFQSAGLSIARTYNSRRLSGASTPFGTGWSDLYGERLIFPSAGSVAALHVDGEGYFERYDRQGTTDVYRSINQPGSVLTKIDAVTWELRDGQELFRRFDGAGRLLLIGNVNRPELDVAIKYSEYWRDIGSGLFVPIGAVERTTDLKGRSTFFEYELVNTTPGSCSIAYACSARRLRHVNLPDGGVVSYTYDSFANLSSVTYPDGSGRQYHYNEAANICPTSMPGACTGGTVPTDGFPHLLTGISDVPAPGSMLPVSRFATYQYDHHERVISSAHAGGVDRLELAYTGPAQATLTLPSGKQRVIDFTTGLFRKERAWLDIDTVTGTQRTTTFTFDTAGRPVTMTDPRGVVRTYEYSANGLHRTATINATGTASQQRIESDWDSTLNVVLETRRRDAASNVVSRTVHARNARGQATATCEIDPRIRPRWPTPAARPWHRRPVPRSGAPS